MYVVCYSNGFGMRLSNVKLNSELGGRKIEYTGHAQRDSISLKHRQIFKINLAVMS
jgi:hypothetical protein